MAEMSIYRPGRPRQFQQGELTQIRKMVNDIIKKKITYKEARIQYGVTKYQVEKWLFFFRSKLVAKEAQSFDEALQMKIAKMVFTGELKAHEAAKKYNVSISTVNHWIRTMPGLKRFGNIKTPSESSATISTDTMIRVARQILAKDLTTSAAARIHKVTRHTIRNWVRDYGMFNLDGTVDHETLSSMPDNEKEKELLKQIESLKKQLSDEKLRTLGLETLIEVAEQKFNIKLKKKPGSTQ